MPSLKYLFLVTASLGLFFLSNIAGYGAGFRVLTVAEDTIVHMHGYVYDSVSFSPATLGVKAKIILESLPHGSEVGIITSDDSTGFFEYYINLKHDYRIEINSDRHRIFIENMNPRYYYSQGEIIRTYYLEPEVKENQVIRLKDLIFPQGESVITPESFGELNRLVNLMNENPGIQIQLEGHTDYRGGKKLNMDLSQNRVDAVKNYLVAKGIIPKRIRTKAFGGSQPLIKEKSIEASDMNRRVEVRILKIE